MFDLVYILSLHFFVVFFVFALLLLLVFKYVGLFFCVRVCLVVLPFAFLSIFILPFLAQNLKNDILRYDLATFSGRMIPCENISPSAKITLANLERQYLKIPFQKYILEEQNRIGD